MQSEQSNGEEESSLGPALWSVAIAGALVTLTSPMLFGAMGIVSVGIGGALAVANLWLVGRTVKAFLGARGTRPSWGVLAIVKLGALLLLLGAAVKNGWLEILPLWLRVAAARHRVVAVPRFGAGSRGGLSDARAF
jgi:hypothetical protein